MSTTEELGSSFKAVFEGQDIKNVNIETITITLARGENDPNPKKIEPKTIKKFAVADGKGGIVLDWDKIKTRDDFFTYALALIYGRRNGDDFRHDADSLFFGWREVLGLGKTPVNMERRPDAASRSV
jgi:hypothetical protein